MGIRMANASDPTGHRLAYAIPYNHPNQDTGVYEPLTILGTRFSRFRILTSASSNGSRPDGASKYLQSRSSGTHIYFPPITPVDFWYDPKVPIVITEGEKKAARACQEGVLTCALGGVDSWRSQRLVLDSNRIANTGPNEVSIQLDDFSMFKVETLVCDEFLTIPWDGREVTLCYDLDRREASRIAVQRSAFDFGIWLESNGAIVRSVVLPQEGKKVGLDDYFNDHDKEDFLRLMRRSTFPVRPHTKSFIQKTLGQARKGRPTYIKVSRSILSDLDGHGTRYRDKLGNFFYFDDKSKRLFTIPYRTSSRRVTSSHFLHYLVREYRISTADSEVFARLLDDFESMPNIVEVDRTARGSTTIGDTLYYQLSDSQIARVSAEGIDMVTNGDEGVLFEETGTNESTHLIAPPDDPDFGWVRTLRQTALQTMPGFTPDETYVFVACLFYLSPWLRRWRGLTLPAELAISEPGSGKTSLYQLRKGIFTGQPRLNQAPEDLRSWYAAISNTSGIWVGDNIGHKIDNVFSNEIARLITDPEPTVELRELYTTADIARKHIDCVFAFTSIYNAFTRPDLLQRSVVLEFSEIQKRDGMWIQHQLYGGGRELWVSHHLNVIKRFFQLVPKFSWSAHSTHRLVHFEQAMRCMGHAIGKGQEIESALANLAQVVTQRIRLSDPIMEALTAFANELPESQHHAFTAQDIIDWVLRDPLDRFSNFDTFEGTRRLTRYIAQHKSDVHRSTGIAATETTKLGLVVYSIDPTIDRSNSG